MVIRHNTLDTIIGHDCNEAAWHPVVRPFVEGITGSLEVDISRKELIYWGGGCDDLKEYINLQQKELNAERPRDVDAITSWDILLIEPNLAADIQDLRLPWIPVVVWVIAMAFIAAYLPTVGIALLAAHIAGIGYFYCTEGTYHVTIAPNDFESSGIEEDGRD